MTMLRRFMTCGAAVAAVALAPAAHAQITTGPGTTVVITTSDLGPDGSFTQGFADSNLTNPFTETVNFTTSTFGTLSLIVSTIATSAVNDTDFTNVFLTGTGILGNVAVPETSPDPSEVRSLAGLNVGPGSFTLTVQGRPGTSNGSFGGTLAFAAASAVPEPSTWAMMLIGFGAVGYSMRRRKVGYQALQAA
jgi:ABC-type sugar transport system substrate-binding protein